MDLDTLIEYKEILVDNLPEWKDTTDLRYIELKKLTGLTNATYRAKNNDPNLTTSNKIAVIRIFGTVEGLVDKAKEHTIFNELGKNGAGPKCLAYGGSWRIEEYIDQGVHPDLITMRSKTYRRLIAKYLSQFHKIQLSNIPREEPSIKKYLDTRTESFKPFFDKMKQGELFSAEEKEKLKEFEEIVSEKEVEFLYSILPKSETRLCHNDLNNLNIFYNVNTSSGNRLKFIDFEYCSYNYCAYDIANYMNESHFNYNFPEDPYYDIVKENVFKIDDINDFVEHYIAAKHIEDESVLSQFEDEIAAAANDESAARRIPLKYALKYMSQDSFVELCNQLVYEVLCCQILSNWYWVVWSVITAKAPGMLFNHIHYGAARHQIFKDLKTQLSEFSQKQANI
ncbi:hypothetical protein ABPG74_011721 [Tetrahymena malaccensis]